MPRWSSVSAATGSAARPTGSLSRNRWSRRSALAKALSAPNPPKTVLLDSLDVWVANLLLAHENEDPALVESLALAELERLLAACCQGETNSVLVSSEVGLSPVPPNRLGRQFQDLLGTVNQQAAAGADTLYLVVAGIPLQVKPQ